MRSNGRRLGKTVMFSFLVRSANAKGKKVLILTHRIELITQAGGALQRVGLDPLKIEANKRGVDLTQNLHTAMIETITRRMRKKEYVDYVSNLDLIIIDECFIAGTIVSGRKIEDLRPGDIVDSFNHQTNSIEKNKVLKVSKKIATEELLKINFLDEYFVCTKEHPIFVIGKGYIKAKDLRENDKIIRINKVHELRSFDGKEKLQKNHMEFQNSQVEKRNKFILLTKLCFNFLFSGCFKENDRKKPNEIRTDKIKDVRYSQEDRTQASNSRWEWEGYDKNTRESFGFSWGRMVSRISGKNRKWIPSISLQNRRCSPIKKDSYRNRWGESFFNKSKRGGSKKTKFFGESRVQSIEVFKQGYNKELGGGFKGTYVYNLEVENNNNYFANNILVHNCHMGNFDKFFSYISPKTVVLGFTATPHREGNQKPLADYYEKIVEVTTISELVRDGYLSNPRSYGVKIDLKGVKSRGGDYDSEELAQKYHENKIWKGVVENYNRITPNSKAIAFCPNIKSSKELCQSLNESGLNAKYLHGDTHPIERKEILKWFKNTSNAIVCNVGVLTTGFDEPTIETVILYRATKSLPLFLQMVGRGSRVTDTKSNFTILDFGNNIRQHGFWEDDREWELKKKEKRSKKDGAFPVKECPACGALIHASKRDCEYCGHHFKEKSKFKSKEVAVLEEIESKGMRVNRVVGLEVDDIVEAIKMKVVNPNAVLHRMTDQGKAYELVTKLGYKRGWFIKRASHYEVFRKGLQRG